MRSNAMFILTISSRSRTILSSASACAAGTGSTSFFKRTKPSCKNNRYESDCFRKIFFSRTLFCFSDLILSFSKRLSQSLFLSSRISSLCCKAWPRFKSRCQLFISFSHPAICDNFFFFFSTSDAFILSLSTNILSISFVLLAKIFSIDCCFFARTVPSFLKKALIVTSLISLASVIFLFCSFLRCFSLPFKTI